MKLIDDRIGNLCHMHRITFLLYQPNMQWIASFNGEQFPDCHISSAAYSVDEAVRDVCDRVDQFFVANVDYDQSQE